MLHLIFMQFPISRKDIIHDRRQLIQSAAHYFIAHCLHCLSRLIVACYGSARLCAAFPRWTQNRARGCAIWEWKRMKTRTKWSGTENSRNQGPASVPSTEHSLAALRAEIRNPRLRNPLRMSGCLFAVFARKRALHDELSHSEFCVPPFHIDAYIRVPFDTRDVYDEILFAIAIRKRTKFTRVLYPLLVIWLAVTLAPLLFLLLPDYVNLFFNNLSYIVLIDGDTERMFFPFSFWRGDFFLSKNNWFVISRCELFHIIIFNDNSHAWDSSVWSRDTAHYLIVLFLK